MVKLVCEGVEHKENVEKFAIFRGITLIERFQMNKIAKVAVIMSAVLMFIGCASFPRSVSRPIVNNTGTVIAKVYIKDSEAASWGIHSNRVAQTTTQSATCKHCTGGKNGGCYDVYCTQTVYVKDREGNIVYDTKNLDNGESYDYRFSAPGASDGQPVQYKSIDIKFVDVNGFVYGKNNVNLTNNERIVITRDDLYPVLTMQNNTGFPISIASPISENIGNNSSTIYQIPELKDDRKHIVSYSISGYRFDKEVVLDGHTTLSLTDRPPTVTIKNNTGYPITINSPFSEFVANGGSSSKFPKSNRNINSQIISYHSGLVEYKKEVIVDNEDVVLTLTEKDRPPIVTVLNNTGNTVNLVFLRNPGSNWPEHNILSLKLKEDGTLDNTTVATQAGERRGSFTNKETFRFWLGNLNVKPDKYDIRIDDVQGSPYVKNNVHITEDMILTFTPKDKP